MTRCKYCKNKTACEHCIENPTFFDEFRPTEEYIILLRKIQNGEVCGFNE